MFMVPLEAEYGWSRAMISASIAVNIALFGLIGPFAASVMDRWGLRRVVLGALALMASAVALSTRMTTEWQFLLLWGVLVGASTGVTSMVLAAVVRRDGSTSGAAWCWECLSAANATGQLIFLPQLARVVDSTGWRTAALIVAAQPCSCFSSCCYSCAIVPPMLVCVRLAGRPMHRSRRRRVRCAAGGIG